MVELAAKRQLEKADMDAKVYAAICEFEQEATVLDLAAALRLLPKRLDTPLYRLERRGLVRSWRALTVNKKGVGLRYYRKVEITKTGT